MGGFIAESVGVQYDFYVVVAICGIIFMRESNAPVIQLRREKNVIGSRKGSYNTPPLL